MDIVAKRIPADQNGVRIAQLDEITYRKTLWSHRPLTDFWRIGPGYARKLEKIGLCTMGDIARCSLGKQEDFYCEERLYQLFGINAELLIDHAWGWEPCTMQDIKAYKPSTNSICSGQVLQEPYSSQKARLIAREMADLLVLDLVEKGLVTNQLVLSVGYDIDNLTDPQRRKQYKGPITTDHYGRKVPKHAHGSISLKEYSSSTKEILEAVSSLFDRIVDNTLLVRRLTITANNVIRENMVATVSEEMQLDLFSSNDDKIIASEQTKYDAARERRCQQALLDIKRKYGKNAILKGMNLEDGATAMERNRQIGGHKA